MAESAFFKIDHRTSENVTCHLTSIFCFCQLLPPILDSLTQIHFKTKTNLSSQKMPRPHPQHIQKKEYFFVLELMSSYVVYPALSTRLSFNASSGCRAHTHQSCCLPHFFSLQIQRVPSSAPSLMCSQNIHLFIFQ